MVALPCRFVCFAFAVSLLLSFGFARGDELPKEISFGEALILAPVGRGGRVPFPIDPVAARIADGTWQPPKAGDTVPRGDGRPRTWEKLSPGKDGGYDNRALNGGYTFFSISSPQDRVMVLDASGHGMVWVNGEPRTGDPYSYGYVHVPVQLKKGANEFLFVVARGQLRAKLSTPPADGFLNAADVTTPDLVVGEKYDGWAAVPVINATTSWRKDQSLTASIAGGELIETKLRALPPLSVSKVPFRIACSSTPSAATNSAKLQLKLSAANPDKPLATTDLTLRVVKPEQTRKVTFLSKIDGSVQYFGLVPATPSDKTPGLTLTLHGAGVEGSGQAACFTPKSWTHVVAATNRRPYGFDWEDWGRLDALEVLDEALHRLKVDPHRRWLTGHSMGGHGTWHLGVTFPDKFAAIGPSAGWISMMSYAGVTRPDHPDPMADLFQRAASAGDTLALVKNLASVGIYVLHGDQDDNVPVEQAREMRKVLAGFHGDWAYYERVGAGHWWGNPCVDWPQMSEFFSQRTLPEKGDVKHVQFTTASPSVSAECDWAIIEQQQQAFNPSSIDINQDRDKRSFSGKTQNVACLGLDVRHLKPGAPLQIELDGQKFVNVAWPAQGGTIWLDHSSDKWRAGTKPSADSKTAARSGPFRNVFRNDVLFVVGTKGSADENAWALQKARFDAENFWYRGNGNIQIVLDSSFGPAKERDRNVVLYGNANTNGAWDALLGKSPVQTRSSAAVIGGRETKGDNFACVFVRPRPGSETASVGAVSGTGVKGMRSTDRLPFFVSGVGYPDCVLFGPDALNKGTAGVTATGFFGNDWSVEHGEFVWR